MDDRTLGELVRRAQNGDREAAGELIRRYEGRVRASVRRRLGADLRKRIDTDDIFQSAIAASLDGLKGLHFEGEDALIGWLTTVAERRLIGAVRRHRAGKRDVSRESPLRSADRIQAGRTSPTQGAVRGEAQQSVKRAVSRLPPDERRVVELRSYEGLTFEEIATRLGLSDRHAARERFRSALRRMGDLLDS